MPFIPTFSSFFTLLNRALENADYILTALVQKARQGNSSAQATLYNQFARQMFGICVRMAGNYDDAKELLHDSFITAFKQLGQLREMELFGPWLRRIVVNECIRHSKKRVIWKSLDNESVENYEEENVDWITAIDFEHIQQEIRNLPAGCREIFNLYVLEDYSHQEIAGILNISLSTSKSQYQRARQLLKERLLKHLVRHGSI